MPKLLDYVKNKSIYFLESIKNRFPCHLIKVRNITDMNKKTIITYQAATKLNIRKTHVKELIDDSLLIEKFHPTDCIKIGFLAAAEIFLKESKSLEEAQEKYRKISLSMFENIMEDNTHADKQ